MNTVKLDRISANSWPFYAFPPGGLSIVLDPEAGALPDSHRLPNFPHHTTMVHFSESLSAPSHTPLHS